MKTSIIVLTYNNLNLNKKCLKSLLKMTTGDFEIIVVDNNSTDGTKEYLKRLKDKRIKIFILEQNLGFAKGMNYGAEKARGEIIILLNNDTEVTNNWLSPLLKAMEKDRVGIVAPKMLYPDGKIQHAGIVISSDHIPRHIYRRFKSNFGPANKSREFQAVTGACLVIRGDLWKRLGGFDNSYLNGLEDIDLCFRAKELGYKIFYVPESVIIHYESVSKDRFANYFNNRELYLKRWSKVTPDEDSHYREDGFGSLFIFIQHINNRYLTGGYLKKIKVLIRNFFSVNS